MKNTDTTTTTTDRFDDLTDVAGSIDEAKSHVLRQFGTVGGKIENVKARRLMARLVEARGIASALLQATEEELYKPPAKEKKTDGDA